MSKIAKLLFVSLLVLALSAVALAQSTTTGSIGGVVSNPNKEVVSGAAVTVRNIGTNKEDSATTDDTGRFKVANLQPGNYRLVVQRIGYHHHDAYSRYLELGQPTDISRETVGDLKKLSNEGPVSESNIAVTSSGEFSTSLPLCENDVYFLSLARE